MVLFGLASEIWILYVAQVASGVLACAVLPVSMAYIGDSSTESCRSGVMGKLGAAAGLGIIIGLVLEVSWLVLACLYPFCGAVFLAV